MLLVADVVAKNRRRNLTEEAQSLWGIAKLNAICSEIPAVTHVDYIFFRIDAVSRPLRAG
jgi:carbamoyltransferase